MSLSSACACACACAGDSPTLYLALYWRATMTIMKRFAEQLEARA